MSQADDPHAMFKRPGPEIPERSRGLPAWLDARPMPNARRGLSWMAGGCCALAALVGCLAVGAVIGQWDLIWPWLVRVSRLFYFKDGAIATLFSLGVAVYLGWRLGSRAVVWWFRAKGE